MSQSDRSGVGARIARVVGALAFGLHLGAPALAAPTFFTDAAAFDSALAGLSGSGVTATVETFDMLVAGSWGSSFTAPSGIGFSTGTADMELLVRSSTAPSTSGFNALGQRFVGPGGPFDEQFGFGTVLDIDLGTATNAFSAALVNNLSFFLPEDVVIDVNGATGTIEDASNTTAASGARFAFIGVIDAATAFSDVRMTFDTTASTSIGELDDVTFYSKNTPVTPAIPVPAALPLLLGGLGALAALRRRTA